jgi:NAD-dependent SIR2 family protein deacetylase
MNDSIHHQAARAIAEAECIFVGAGAGIGVDSGLPDFRGKEGFWKAYPVFRKLKYSFEEMANPAWFSRDPEQAWGFYGHRLNTYRAIAPHAGFEILKKWMDNKKSGGFVFTSNVDGHFQKAGFYEEQIYECHGSIHWLQSCTDADGEIWSADEVELEVDSETCRASQPLPLCPETGGMARPNILMFSDYMWNGRRSDEQSVRLREWLEKARQIRGVIIEIGAGKAVPTVRVNCERFAEVLNYPMIRINPRDAQGPQGILSIQGNAAQSLKEINAIISAG